MQGHSKSGDAMTKPIITMAGKGQLLRSLQYMEERVKLGQLMIEFRKAADDKENER